MRLLVLNSVKLNAKVDHARAMISKFRYCLTVLCRTCIGKMFSRQQTASVTREVFGHSIRIFTHANAPRNWADSLRPVKRLRQSGSHQAATLDFATDSRKEKLETYKLYDQATVTVRSGNGGKGEVVKEGQGRMVKNFKYTPGGRQPKQIFLPAGEPVNGEHGGDVWIVVDPAVDSLAHLHKRSLYTARNGANGSSSTGHRASIKAPRMPSSKAEPLRILVPPGTVVKTKKGVPLGELIHAGDRLKVARGGQGGLGSRDRSGQSAAPSRNAAAQLARGIEEYEVEDSDTKADCKGSPGETVALQLFLSVVADIGIVGLPNAGKSSLLAAMTRASPEVADYPFTTLTPNLGVIQSQENFERETDGASAFEEDLVKPSRATLADLPGLIQGAHTGKGLGRMFLRHLKRTNALLHVLDASTGDPSSDFWAVREELRMYNPAYCEKPYIVALNKMDLPDARELEEEVRSEVQNMAANLKETNSLSRYALPVGVFCTSALEGRGVEELSAALQSLAKEQSDGLS